MKTLLSRNNKEFLAYWLCVGFVSKEFIVLIITKGMMQKYRLIQKYTLNIFARWLPMGCHGNLLIYQYIFFNMIFNEHYFVVYVLNKPILHSFFSFVKPISGDHHRLLGLN